MRERTEDGRLAAVDAERPRSCPRGHAMTEENTRVRWIRGRVYPLRECRQCIRAKAAARRATAAGRAYHAKYQRDHYTYGGRHGARAHMPAMPKKLVPLTEAEKLAAQVLWADKDGLYAAHLARIAARFNRRFGWRLARERLVFESIQAERREMLANVSPDSELAKLIAAQERDAATFQIKRPALFVPAEQAEALFYGVVHSYELS